MLSFFNRGKFFQNNYNPDHRAHKPDFKYVADDTYYEDDEKEEAEGASGTISVVVDSGVDKYFVVMPDLSLSEGTFDVEN